MAKNVTVDYTGGPCNGKVDLIPLTTVQSGTVSCGGAFYSVGPVSGGKATATFKTQVLPVGGVAPQAMSGWNALRYRINRTLPAELYRADVYLRQTLHELRRIRVR